MTDGKRDDPTTDEASTQGAGSAEKPDASKVVESSDESKPDESMVESTSDESKPDESTPDETSSEPAAQVLEREAAAAKEAVDEAGRTDDQPRYPPPDARTQKIAGWGCLLLLVGLTLGFMFVFRAAFVRLTSLETNTNGFDVETYVAPGNETRRADRVAPTPPRAAGPNAGGVAWRTDFGEAVSEARRANRPLLVHFEARWAVATHDMLDGTYANVAVREALASFVPIRVDLTDRDEVEEELTARYQVSALPHVLYLAPDGGRLRPDSTSLVDAADMEVFLAEALGAFRDGRRYVPPVPEEAPQPEGTTEGATQPEGAPSEEAPQPEEAQ